MQNNAILASYILSRNDLGNVIYEMKCDYQVNGFAVDDLFSSVGGDDQTLGADGNDILKGGVGAGSLLGNEARDGLQSKRLFN